MHLGRLFTIPRHRRERDWQRYSREGQARELTGQVTPRKKLCCDSAAKLGLEEKSTKFGCELYVDWEGRRVAPADPLQNLLQVDY